MPLPKVTEGASRCRNSREFSADRFGVVAVWGWVEGRSVGGVVPFDWGALNKLDIAHKGHTRGRCEVTVEPALSYTIRLPEKKLKFLLDKNEPLVLENPDLGILPVPGVKLLHS